MGRDTSGPPIPPVVDEPEVRSPERVPEENDGCKVQRDDEEDRSPQRVARVIDGDTVQLEDGRKVRYAGINAPEDGQRYFQEATQANNDLVGGKDVTLEFGRGQRERYERLLAYVSVGDTFVQGELVRRGLAIVARTQPLPRYRSV